METRVALVRRPGARLAEGIVTHIARAPVDLALAMQQWEGYVAVMRDEGWAIVEVPPAPDCPDAVFIEDTVVMFRGLAVVTHPGAEARRPETLEVARVLASLGYPMCSIVAPGTLDGGDVLKVGNTVYVGRGGRSNDEGIRQLRALLAPLGATVVAVPLGEVLHLKSAVTALPDGTILGWAPVVDDAAIFPRFLAVPEESGAHVVLLGEGRLLMADDCPRSAQMFRALGYTPVPVDISEFVKLEGCVTCLSVRLREQPAASVEPREPG